MKLLQTFPSMNSLAITEEAATQNAKLNQESKLEISLQWGVVYPVRKDIMPVAESAAFADPRFPNKNRLQRSPADSSAI